MSDAAQKRFIENGGNIQDAINYAKTEHSKWLKIWGNESNFAQAHGEFGIELPREFGLDRTLISVTDNANVSNQFGQTIFKGEFSESDLIRQTISDTGEGEYLIRFGTNKLNKQ
jgi:filamentous hemagglutinin